MSRRAWRRGAAAAVGVGVLALTGAASGSTPDLVYPHLPKVNGQLQGTLTDTISYVPPSRQWIRVPRVTMAVDVETLPNYGTADSYCSRKYGVAMCTPAPDTQYRLVIHAQAYPVDPQAPLSASRFADFPTTTIRTVAFGSVPMQATVHLSLPLDSEGLPVGLRAAGVTDSYHATAGPGVGQFPPTGAYDAIGDSTITGQLNVRIGDLTVDGRLVSLGANCQAESPATLTGRGVGFLAGGGGELGIPLGHYNPRAGGTINGTLDVPQFTGCGTDGDNLDALVSTMASGKGFPVQIEQGELASCWASPPSAIKPETCGEPHALPFPVRSH